MKLFIVLILLPFYSYSQNYSFKKHVAANLAHKHTFEGKLVRGQGQVVAVVDSGMSPFSPELLFKQFLNPFEVADDGLDNDRNGYIDDVYGWDFHDNDFLPQDDNIYGHGTHVAGIIAGKKQGIAPDALILPLKVTDDPKTGTYNELFLYKAIMYAVNRGVKIINLSLGGVYINRPVATLLMESAIDYALAHDVLIIVAAGNSAWDISDIPVYPATFDKPNVITVCAVDKFNRLAKFSNYSASKVDFCAPGVNLLAANNEFNPFNNPQYLREMSGTSMATPVVAGIVALLKSMKPDLRPFEIKEILNQVAKRSSFLTPKLKDYSKTGGVVNAYQAVLELERRLRP